ncbi:MAG: helix-turn-helix transcriptional regulator [Lachnospiraceae bacterium]|nr:helix-turn-helix transcriptional regulator [Lachnospiraceae bacterium]
MYYENFEALCKKHKTNASRVSKATGISTATLTSWKKGAYTPKADKLQKIADYFGVSLAYLLGQEEPEPNAVDQENKPYVLDDEALELLEELKTRPEMRTLFSVSKKATKEDILKAVKIIEALKGDD